MLKFKKTKIETSKGSRNIYFKGNYDHSEEILECAKYCTYADVCQKLKYPSSDESHKDEDFSDFCSDINFAKSEDETSVDVCWIPVPGTLEENLGDVIKEFVKPEEKDNKILEKCVRIDAVIDSSCDGFCSKYQKDHKNCNCGNSLCILKSLFTAEEKKEE